MGAKPAPLSHAHCMYEKIALSFSTAARWQQQHSCSRKEIAHIFGADLQRFCRRTLNSKNLRQHSSLTRKDSQHHVHTPHVQIGLPLTHQDQLGSSSSSSSSKHSCSRKEIAHIFGAVLQKFCRRTLNSNNSRQNSPLTRKDSQHLVHTLHVQVGLPLTHQDQLSSSSRH